MKIISDLIAFAPTNEDSILRENVPKLQYLLNSDYHRICKETIVLCNAWISNDIECWNKMNHHSIHGINRDLLTRIIKSAFVSTDSDLTSLVKRLDTISSYLEPYFICKDILMCLTLHSSLVTKDTILWLSEIAFGEFNAISTLFDSVCVMLVSPNHKSSDSNMDLCLRLPECLPTERCQKLVKQLLQNALDKNMKYDIFDVFHNFTSEAESYVNWRNRCQSLWKFILVFGFDSSKKRN